MQVLTTIFLATAALAGAINTTTATMTTTTVPGANASVFVDVLHNESNPAISSTGVRGVDQVDQPPTTVTTPPVDDKNTKVCCRAWLASCLACAAGVTEDAFCRVYPKTIGCHNNDDAHHKDNHTDHHDGNDDWDHDHSRTTDNLGNHTDDHDHLDHHDKDKENDWDRHHDQDKWNGTTDDKGDWWHEKGHDHHHDHPHHNNTFNDFLSRKCSMYAPADCIVGPALRFCEVDYQMNLCVPRGKTSHGHDHHHDDHHLNCSMYSPADCIVGPALRFCKVDYKMNLCVPRGKTGHHYDPKYPDGYPYPPSMTGATGGGGHQDDRWDGHWDHHDGTSGASGPAGGHDLDGHHGFDCSMYTPADCIVGPALRFCEVDYKMNLCVPLGSYWHGPNDDHHHWDPPNGHGGHYDGDNHDDSHAWEPCCDAATLACLSCRAQETLGPWMPPHDGHHDGYHDGGHHGDGRYDPNFGHGGFGGFDDMLTGFISGLNYGNVTSLLANTPYLTVNKQNSTAILAVLKGHDGNLGQWGADLLEQAHTLLSGLTLPDISDIGDEALFGTELWWEDEYDHGTAGGANGADEEEDGDKPRHDDAHGDGHTGDAGANNGENDHGHTKTKDKDKNKDGALGAFGQRLDWDKDQASALADKLKAFLKGDVAKATGNLLKAAGTVLEGFTPDDIAQIADAAWAGAKDAFKRLCRKKGGLDAAQVAAIQARVKANDIPEPQTCTAAVVADVGGLLGTLDDVDLQQLPADVMGAVAPEAIEVMGAGKIARAWDAGLLDALSDAAKHLVNGADLAGGAFSKDQIKALVGRRGETVGCIVDFVKAHDAYTSGEDVLADITELVREKLGSGFKGTIRKIQDSMRVVKTTTSNDDTNNVEKKEPTAGGDAQAPALRRRRRRLLNAAGAANNNDLETVVRVETTTNTDAATIATEAAAADGDVIPVVVPVDATDTPGAAGTQQQASNGANDPTLKHGFPWWFWAAVGAGSAVAAMGVLSALVVWRLRRTRAVASRGTASNTAPAGDLTWGRQQEELPKATYVNVGLPVTKDEFTAV